MGMRAPVDDAMLAGASMVDWTQQHRVGGATVQAGSSVISAEDRTPHGASRCTVRHGFDPVHVRPEARTSSTRCTSREHVLVCRGAGPKQPGRDGGGGGGGGRAWRWCGGGHGSPRYAWRLVTPTATGVAARHGLHHGSVRPATARHGTRCSEGTRSCLEPWASSRRDDGAREAALERRSTSAVPALNPPWTSAATRTPAP